MGRWGAGWVGRKAAGAGENVFERLSVAGVRGTGVSGFVKGWDFPLLLPLKTGRARSVERKLGGGLRGKRLAAHSPFKVYRRVKGVGHTQVALKCFSGLARNAQRFHPSKPCGAFLLALANNLANSSAEKWPASQQNSRKTA